MPRRSDEQRRAMFARIAARRRPKRKHPSFSSHLPLALGLAAGISSAIGAKAITPSIYAKAMKHVELPNAIPKGVMQLRLLLDKLHPYLRKVPVFTNSELAWNSGSSFINPTMNKLGNFLSPSARKFKKEIGAVAYKRVLEDSLVKEPQVHILKNTTPEYVAHELGHAVIHHGARGKIMSPLTVISRALSKGYDFTPSIVTKILGKLSPETLNNLLSSPRKLKAFNKISALSGNASTTLTTVPLMASLAAQPVISYSGLSDEKKKKLRIASAALPLAVASPMLLDEAGASIIGSRAILKSDISNKFKRIKHLAHGFNSYLVSTAPGAVGGGVAAGGYLLNDRNRRLRKVRRLKKKR